MRKVNNYFSHDFNARNDIKLKKVNMQLGLQGIGLYWCIIECLYENNGYLTLDDDIDLLAYELRVDKDLILNLIENFDLFKKQKNRFYSPSVLSRLQKITDKANKNRENVLKRWEKVKEKSISESNSNEIQENYDNDTNVLHTNYYKKEKKREEKKIKENKDIIIHTTTDNNIYSFVEENFGRTLSPLEIEKINQWSLEFKEDVFQYAISIAVMNHKATFAYVEGILKNWKAKGFSSLKEITDDELRGYSKTHPRENIELTEEQKEIFDYNWLDGEEEDE